MKHFWSKSAILLVILTSISSSIYTQATSVFTGADRLFHTAMDSYHRGLYDQASQEFGAYIELQREVQDEDSDLALWRADMYYHFSLLYGNHPDSEVLLAEFIKKHEPSLMSQEASLALANYFFDAKSYKKALLYYAGVKSNNIAKDDLAQLKFRQGFSYFNTKDFKSAVSSFDQVPLAQVEYGEDAMYYKGISHYFLGNYEEASSNFNEIALSSKYVYHIPYYNSIIYAENEAWGKIVEYLMTRIKDPRIKNKKELNLILGQAYYETDQFSEALGYLEAYNNQSSKMRAEEFYQLAYTQYKTEKYQDAIQNFLEITNQNNIIGQNANFYLAECYLRLGNKKHARTAFSRAYKQNFDQRIKDEALYNYALLSMDQQDDRASVDALIQIQPSSPHYDKAQTFLAEVFLNTRDYKRAIDLLGDIERNSVALKKSYQMVTYYYAIQSTDDGNLEQAKKYFQKSLEENIVPDYSAAATFWIGYIQHKEKKTNQSIAQLKKYLTLNTTNSPTAEASVEMANYLLGYNYFEKEEFNLASQYYSKASSDILPEAIRSDNYLRLADCQFALNDYSSAMANYTNSSKYSQKSEDYVMYQQGLLHGLMNAPYKKIKSLEQLATTMPKSKYASHALYEKGLTELGEEKRIQAIESFNRIVQAYPSSSLVNKASLQLGLIYYNNGESQRAISRYRFVLSNNPNKKESNEAIAAVEEIYIDDLKNPNGYASFLNDFPSYKIGNSRRDSLTYRVAYQYYEDGNYNEAIKSFGVYLDAFKAGIQAIDARYFRGESKALLQQYHEAYIDYSDIIAKGPSERYASSLYKAAIIASTHDKDYIKAYEHYSALASLGNTSDKQQEIYVGAMKAAVKIKNREGTKLYTRYILDSPLSTDYDKGLAYYYTATLAQENQEYSIALMNFNKASKLLNNELSAESNYRIGEIYFIRNQFDLSEIYAESAVKKNSNYPYWVAKNLMLLSDVLSIKGDYFNARAALEAVLENYNSDTDIQNEAKEKLIKIKNREAQNTRVDQSNQKENIQFQDYE